MVFLKDAFFTACGALFVLTRMQGHPIISNWIFLIWLIGSVAYYAIKDTKKED